MKQEQYKQFLEKSIKNIQKALNENYLSIFAGSGVSVNSNLPNWSELMEKIAKELYGPTNDKEAIIQNILREKLNDFKTKINIKGNEDDFVMDMTKELCKIKDIPKEDNLFLAEKFYQQFGDDHYYEILNKYIPNSAVPNCIHKKIVRMNIKNLITTNWDNLFEKAISDEEQHFAIIKKDDDIREDNLPRKFIKMHGSLDEHNIVFKEKDYLEYSDNFPFIENRIKEIFFKDVVIMLGYSLNDNNVKQIISWVKKHSKKEIQIYLIELSRNFDKADFDYYNNNFNVSILYINMMFIENDKKKQLERFLNIIDSDGYPLDVNDLKLQNMTNDEFNKFLKKFDDFEFVIIESFVRDFKNHFKLSIYEISYSVGVIHIGGKKMESADMSIYQKIANLTKIPVYIKQQYIKPDFENTNNHLLETLFYFNFKNIEKEIKKISLKIISEKEELKMAFLLYQNEKCLESYETLKKVSKNAVKNNNYVVWYIAEMNRQHFIFKNVTEDIEEQVNKYLQEINQYDLEEKYLNLSKEQRIKLKYIKNIELYIANNALKIYELRDKIKQDYYTYKNGNFNINYNIQNLTNIMCTMFNFELNEYLMINLDDLYKNIAEGLLIDRFLDGLKQTNISKQQTYKSDNKAINIEMYPILVYLVLKYFYKEEELKMILNDYGKKEYIFNFDNSGVETIFKNICDKFTKNGAFKTYYSQLFNNFLIFTAWFELNQETFNFIIERVDNKLDNNLLGIPQYDAINYFLVYQYNKNKYKTNKICFDNIEKIICTYLEAFICGRFGGYNVLALQHSSVFHNMSIILKEKKIAFNANTNQKIRLFIDDKIEKFDIDTQQYYYENLLSKLYNSADSNTKAKIDKIKNNLEYNHKS